MIKVNEEIDKIIFEDCSIEQIKEWLKEKYCITKFECMAQEMDFNTEIVVFDAQETEFTDVEGKEVICYNKEGKYLYLDKVARLFRGGIQKGINYDEQKLDNIISSFKIPQGEKDWDVPIQTDHSDSVWSTIGQVRSIWRNGLELFGKLRFIGEDVIKRVQSGLFKKISVGLFLKPSCKLREVTVTPFPHVEGAEVFSLSILKKEGEKMDKTNYQDIDNGQKNELELQMIQMKKEWDERAKNLETEIAIYKEKLMDYERTIHYKACLDMIEKFMREGKIPPAGRDKELAFVQTLNPEQIKMYSEILEERPAYIAFTKIGSVEPQKPKTNTDPSEIHREITEMREYLGYKEENGKWVEA